jgi:hypothetical protein
MCGINQRRQLETEKRLDLQIAVSGGAICMAHLSTRQRFDSMITHLEAVTDTAVKPAISSPALYLPLH